MTDSVYDRSEQSRLDSIPTWWCLVCREDRTNFAIWQIALICAARQRGSDGLFGYTAKVVRHLLWRRRAFITSRYKMFSIDLVVYREPIIWVRAWRLGEGVSFSPSRQKCVCECKKWPARIHTDSGWIVWENVAQVWRRVCRIPSVARQDKRVSRQQLFMRDKQILLWPFRAFVSCLCCLTSMSKQETLRCSAAWLPLTFALVIQQRSVHCNNI